MKILVFSDSHGRLGQMIDAIEAERPDRMFFLGDHYKDAGSLADIYPELPIEAVRGNCDWGNGPDRLVIETEGVRFLLTHGHLQNVKAGLTGLIRTGLQEEVDMVCFGHTHRALNALGSEGLWLFNPGTVGGVGARAGYGVLTVKAGKVTGALK